MITKKIVTLTVTSIIMMMLVGCPQQPVSPTPPVVVDQDKCAAACARLQLLNCDEGHPIDMRTKCSADSDCKSGQFCSALGKCAVTCTVFCIDTENNGVWLDPVCVANITECRQIDNCPLAKPKAAMCNENSCPLPSPK